MSALDGMTLVGALGGYRARILPLARRERERWRAVAGAISDPDLRGAALESIDRKGGNSAATSVFAILAPREKVASVVRASVALQTAVDYLDTLGEDPAGEPLRDGLALHAAVCAAIGAGDPAGHWYEMRPDADDGGYLTALADACRSELKAMPATAATGQRLAEAAERCRQGQSRTHVALADPSALDAWARELDPGSDEYRPWELAAGASSSVAIHALIAAASRPSTTPSVAAAIEAAYFPSIGALTVLLDDLVDADADARAGEHNYLDRYADVIEAAERIGRLAEIAADAVSDLPLASRHRAILSGVAGYYVGAANGDSGVVKRRLTEALGPGVRLVGAASRGLGDG